AEGEELLRRERLDRAGVEGRLALARRLEVKPERHQRLARAGRRVEDDVLAGEELEQRLFLRRVELEPGVGRPGEEAVEDLARVAGRSRGETGGKRRAG